MRRVSTRALALLVPDEPGWIDLRGLLLTGRCDVWSEAASRDGFVARSWDYPFASVFARPSAELVLAAVAAGRAAHGDRYPRGEWQLLAAPASRAPVQAALPGWRRRGIVIHRWAGRVEPPEPPAGTEIRLLPDGHRGSELKFDEVPEASRREYLLEWVSRRPMAVALADSRPVSFCYAAFTTERLWDVSVETLEPFRRRGLAAACFRALVDHMAERGLRPAWGAMLDNPASLGLAAKLAFVRAAELDGWSEMV